MIYSPLVLMESQVKFGPQNISLDKIGPFLKKQNKHKMSVQLIWCNQSLHKSWNPKLIWK